MLAFQHGLHSATCFQELKEGIKGRNQRKEGGREGVEEGGREGGSVQTKPLNFCNIGEKS